MRMIVLGMALLAGACAADETLTAYGAADRVWVLESLDGEAFGARAEIRFGPDGAVTGQAPCNRFFATQSAPYPWFELGPIGATRMACPDLAQETAFLSALATMRLAEIAGSTLILSTEAGREMVFRAAPHDG